MIKNQRPARLAVSHGGKCLWRGILNFYTEFMKLQNGEKDWAYLKADFVRPHTHFNCHSLAFIHPADMGNCS